MADAADARRRAEEALANFERFVFIGGPAHPDKPYHDAGVNLATALRALLAAGPEAKTPTPEAPPAIKESLKTDTPAEKPAPSYSPVYCALYPELAKLARKHGYALAIHGSLRRDFDLIAVPWVETPSTPETLVEAFVSTFALHRTKMDPVERLHGRVAYTISVGFGYSALDLSFMPLKPCPSDAVREAAEALTVYCHVCEADRREPCHAVTTGDPAPYPHPERAVAAALAARGGE